MTFSGYDISIIKDIRDCIKEDNILWFKLLLEKYLNLRKQNIILIIITPNDIEKIKSDSNTVIFYIPKEFEKEKVKEIIHTLLDKIYEIIIYLEHLSSLNYIKFREKNDDKKPIHVFGKSPRSAKALNEIVFEDGSKINNPEFILDENNSITHMNNKPRPSIALDLLLWCNRILYIKPELNILIDNNLKTEEEIIFERELEQRERHFERTTRLNYLLICLNLLAIGIATYFSVLNYYEQKSPSKLDKDQFQRIEKILEKK